MESETQEETSASPPDPKSDICLCPICQSTIQEAFVTKCGHSFCHKCIHRHLEERKSCPTCSYALTPSEISPNFALDQVLHSRSFEKSGKSAKDAHHPSSVNDFLRTLNEKSPSLNEIDSLIGGILEMRRKRESDHREAEEEILSEFLTRVRNQKREALEKLSMELRFLDEDIGKLEKRRAASGSGSGQECSSCAEVPNNNNMQHSIGMKRPREQCEPTCIIPNTELSKSSNTDDGTLLLGAGFPILPLPLPLPLPPLLNFPSASSSFPTPLSSFCSPAPGATIPFPPPAPLREIPPPLQHFSASHSSSPVLNSTSSRGGGDDGGSHAFNPFPYWPIPLSSSDHLLSSHPTINTNNATFPFSLSLSPSSPPLPLPSLSSDETLRRATDSRAYSKKLRVASHFDDLKSCYFDLKLSTASVPGRAGLTSFHSGLAGGASPCDPLPPAQQHQSSNGISSVGGGAAVAVGLHQPPAAAVAVGGVEERAGGRSDALELFGEVLSKFMRYETLRPVATLKSADAFSVSNVVASIEFDKDQEFFATAGVTKKIRVFGFEEVLSSTSDGSHYPVCELSSKAKLSCLSWNPYIKTQIVSSDYEGTVALWDVSEAKKVMAFQEHEKRVWSVHFSPVNPTMAVSGSDDATVKVWKTNQKQSAWTINSNANICCVRFNPDNAFHVAFGSADHNIHYYDLRNTKEPLFLFQAHKKAVSCVKFLNSSEFVSASTDNTLKLWNMTDLSCTRTFNGHANERNFVGLSVTDEYLACGSETNTAHVYYKGFHRPALSFTFAPNVDDDDEVGSNHFVSSVCWKKDSNYLIAANSLGVINVLQMA